VKTKKGGRKQRRGRKQEGGIRNSKPSLLCCEYVREVFELSMNHEIEGNVLKND